MFLFFQTCLPCSLGTFGNMSGLSVCPPCLPGSAQNLPAQTTCVPCLGGTFQDQSGQVLMNVFPDFSITHSPHVSLCFVCYFRSSCVARVRRARSRTSKAANLASCVRVAPLRRAPACAAVTIAPQVCFLFHIHVMLSLLKSFCLTGSIC